MRQSHGNLSTEPGHFRNTYKHVQLGDLARNGGTQIKKIGWPALSQRTLWFGEGTSHDQTSQIPQYLGKWGRGI